MPGAPDEAALADVRARLGDAAVLSVDDDLIRYEEPARGRAGRAAVVLRPATTDEVSRVMAWAWDHDIRLLPQGANSGLVGASVPDDSGAVAVLSLERLTGGLVVDPVDRTAVVPAGLRLSALEAALAPHGLTFPIDLSADPSIGGMVSTNAGGCRMVAYGDVRRYVLGLEAVLARQGGPVLDALSTLRKDNTGPALDRLFVGAGGAFGVVTRVALEVVPRPAARATWWVAPTTADDVFRLLAHFERTPARLSAYELLSEAALAATVDAPGGPPNPFGSPVPAIALLVELSGGDDVEDVLETALATAPDGAVADARRVPPEHAWSLRHAVSEAVSRQGPMVGFDISTPRAALAAFRRDAVAVVAASWPGARVFDFGHAGDGGLHFNVVFPPGTILTDDDVAALRSAVYEVVASHGGSYSAEHGIGPTNARWWRELTPPITRELTAALVHVFDPKGLLGHPGLPFHDAL